MANENVDIRIFGSQGSYAGTDAQDEQRVAEIVRSQILPVSDGDYHRVDVKIQRMRDGAPRYLVAYLLRKDSYLAEVVRLDVSQDYQVTQATWSYSDAEDEEDDEEGHVPAQSENGRYGVDFVVATPVPEIPTARQLVDNLYKLFTDRKFTCTKLLGPSATVANYKQYLTSGLKGFVSVGHGNNSEIVLYDGALTYQWFGSLNTRQLKPAVVLFNSCQVFNPPLEGSVMKAGARTYIGGITNLRIGPSEEVSYCFWSKTITTTTSMLDALQGCARAHPDAGTFGIGGDTGRFNNGIVSAMAGAYSGRAAE